MTAFVEPPIASSTRSAFSIDSRVTTRSGARPEAASCTASVPVASARRSRSACTAGTAALPGRLMPSASAETRHRARGAHHRAGAGGDGEVVFDAAISARLTSPERYRAPEPPAISAGAEALTAVAPGHHRPDDELDGGHTGGQGAHQLRGHGLVAAADQHDRAHRLRANHLLDVHRHQVAEHEARGIEEDLPQRNGRKFQRAVRPRPERRA